MPEITNPSPHEVAHNTHAPQTNADFQKIKPNEALAHTEYAPHALSLIAVALLTACGGGGGSGGSGGDIGNDLSSAPGFNNFPQAANDNEAARFLQQSQFASTAADIAAVRSSSYAASLQAQFAKPLSSGWDWLQSRGYGADTPAAIEDYIYSSSIADYMIWSQLMSAPDAMRKRVALALSEFFVVSLNGLEVDWRGYVITAYWDLLNQHAFGHFRDLLEAISLSPAMGYFLNTRGNKKANTSGRLPDENYAREVMQLFTIGLHDLNRDGSVKLDSAGKKIESYDSDDVSELAKVFTGYDFDPTYRNQLTHPNTGGTPYPVWGREYARRPMTFKAADHSTEAINFLGISIAARPGGTGGAAALKTALDGLFNHPNVGPFFGRQMIQRLVTSNPSPAYVERVARAFENNGAGVRGDLKAVWAAILLDDEARSPAGLSSNTFGKLREPMLRLVNWSRSFGAVSAAGSWKMNDLSDPSSSLGQSPLRSPSVFNFFRPGYVPPGTALAPQGITAPEFQIVNETTIGGYLNYIDGIIRNGIRVNNPSSSNPDYASNADANDIVANYTSLLALINNSTSTDAESLRVAQALVASLNLTLTAGQLSASSISTITTALQAAMMQAGRRITNANTTQMDGYRRDLMAAAILLVMASPEYLIQK